mgnify:CR=1 FL=1
MADMNQPPRLFCAVFAILGFMQLFISTKPVTLSGVVMSAAVSAAAASAVGDADAFDGMARNLDALCAPELAEAEAVAPDAPPRYLLRSVTRCALVAAQPFLPFSSQ